MKLKFYTQAIFWMMLILASRGQEADRQPVGLTAEYLEDCKLVIAHDLGSSTQFDVHLTTLEGKSLEFKEQIGNPIVLESIQPKDVARVVFTNSRTGSSHELQYLEDNLLLDCPNKLEINPSTQRGSCGTGMINNYFNCDGEFHDIDRDNLESDMFVHVDDDYITCIAYVDENCDIGESFRTFCTYYPYASAGSYPLGFIHYEQVFGLVEFNAKTGFNVTEEQGEEINWVLCNARDMNYSYSAMNAAIWGILDQVSCNGLCNIARDAIVTPRGDITPFMEFYVPLTGNNVQPQVRNKCVIPGDESFVYICGEDKKVDTYAKGLLDQTPANRFIDIPDPSSVERVVAEVWIKPNQCSGNDITTTLGLSASNGSSTPVDVTVSGINITQTSTSTSIENVYRYTFEGSFGRISVIEGEDGGCSPSSIAVYAVRSQENAAGAIHSTVNREFHQSEHEFSVNVGAAPVARDLTLTVPIHDIGNNNRIARVEAWYNGGPVFSGETSSATHGLEASIINVELLSIPANVGTINVKIISPNNSTGESFGVGSVSISSTQACCPGVTATSDGILCQTSSVTLIATTTMSSPVYSWTGPNGFTSSVATPQVTEAGTYTVTVTDNTSGCVASDNTIVADAGTTTDCSITNNGPLTCANPSIFLDGESTTAGVTFSWTGPNGYTSNDENAVVTEAGTYTLTVSSAGGCPSVCQTLVESFTQSYSSEIDDVICSGQDYVLPDGSVVTTPGSYTVNFPTAEGCDSTFTVNLSVIPAIMIDLTADICNGDSYTLPGGQVVTTPGTYTDVLTTSGGCDSIVKTTVIVHPSFNYTTNATICVGQSYILPDGSAVSAAGTYTNSFTTIFGCDSTYTTHIQVLPAISSDVTAAICDGEGYLLPDGSVATSPGNYSFVLTAANGCDSTVNITLIVSSNYYDVVSAIICTGESYTLPGGGVVTAPGIFVDSLQTFAGCDSVIVTTLDVVPSYQVNDSAVVCVGSGYTLPDGSVVTTPGTYTSTLSSGGGCDSVIITELAMVTSFDQTVDVLLCEGGSYTLPSGTVVTTGGTYIETLTASTGCDSTITTIIVMAPTFIYDVRDTICDGDEYILPSGVAVTTPGVYVNFYNTWQGCDSIITTHLSVLPRSDQITPITICSGETVTLPDGSVINTQGIFGDTLTNIYGCDSTVLTLITILPVFDIVKNVEICIGASYTLPGGTVVTAAGTYIDSLSASTGCDSVITTILDLVPSFDETVQATICMGDSYTLPDGSVVFLPGTWTHLLTASGGCDSTVTTILDVVNGYDIHTPVSICDGESYMFPDSSTSTVSTSYVDSFLTVAGCDSIVTIDLTVALHYDLNVSAQICEGETYILPDGSETGVTGIYIDSLISSVGCDSTITTNLLVYTGLNDTIYATICLGDIYELPRGGSVNTPGTYIDSLISYGGCDSLITTILDVVDGFDIEINATMCIGEVYTLPNGSQTGVPGIWIDTLMSSIGCDSIITTTLTVTYPIEITNAVQICQGQTVTLPDGSVVSVSGTFVDSLIAASGCDSIITTIVDVVDAFNVVDSVQICDSETFTLPGGTVVTSAGTYIDSLTSIAGCDSVITTIVETAPSYDELISAIICYDSYYTLPDGEITISPGTYTYNLTTVQGCDSLITVDLQIIPEYTLWDTVALCDGGSVVLPGGTVVTTAGTYIDSLVSVTSCDSVIISEVIVRPLHQQTTNAAICDGGSYTLPDGTVVTSTGTYTNVLTSEFGCDSVVTTLLTVSNSSNLIIDVTLCDGDYHVLPNGDQTTYAGTYIDTLYSELGCDSIITTNIIVLPHSYAEIDLFVCDADFFVLESGDTITVSDDYLYVINNYVGCDSSILATVTFAQSFEANYSDTICDGDQYLLPSGDTVYTTGIYIDSLETVAGCDSIITVDLTVLPSYSFFVADTICDGETYTLPDGQVVTGGGQFTIVLSTTLGCDSTITTDLVTRPSYHIVNNYEICEGDAITLPTGEVISSETYIEENHTTDFGCDSTIIYDVKMLYPSEHELDYVACGVETVTIADFTYEESGTYAHYHTNSVGCDSVVTVNLVMNQPWETTIDTVLCPGNSVSIAGQEFTSSGEYVLLFTNVYGCDSTYFVNLEYANVPEVTARHDTTIIQGAEVEAYMLDHSDRPLEYTWSVYDTIVIHDVERFTRDYWQSATVKISIRDTNGCVAQDAFRIAVEEECPDDLIFAPNIITPNYDNANDVFDILNPHEVIINEVAIFNRWGEIVHHAKDFETPWNGMFRGMDLDPDVYTYFIQGTCASGNQLLKKGNITLIR